MWTKGRMRRGKRKTTRNQLQTNSRQVEIIKALFQLDSSKIKKFETRLCCVASKLSYNLGWICKALKVFTQGFFKKEKSFNVNFPECQVRILELLSSHLKVSLIFPYFSQVNLSFAFAIYKVVISAQDWVLEVTCKPHKQLFSLQTPILNSPRIKVCSNEIKQKLFRSSRKQLSLADENKVHELTEAS